MKAIFRRGRAGLLGLLSLGLLTAAELGAGPTATVKADRTNVRAKPAFDGEVLATLKQGETVELLGEVPGTGADGSSPREWAKIALPPQVAVWVYGPLVDARTKTVKGQTLNLRAGPGRNYSELGQLTQGAPVTVVRELDGWLQLEPPAGTYAFIARSLIEPAGAPATTATPLPPQPAAAIATRPLATAPTAVPTPAPTSPEPAAKLTPIYSAAPAVAPVAAPADTAATAPATTGSASSAPDDSTPRQVLREGVVRRSWNINAPGHLELRSSRGEGTLDHLVSDDPDIDLAKFRGRRVFVTGEEWRDSRWQTPVLKVKSIQVAD